MKQLILAILLLAVLPYSSQGQLVELARESFENAANDHGYTITPGSECLCCGNGLYYSWHRADVNSGCISSTINGVDGNWFWSAENVDDGRIQDPPSTLSPRAAIILDDVNVSGSTDLEIRVLVGEGATDHFDLGDFLRIQYAFDGGSYQTAAQFIPTGGSESDLAFDSDADGNIDGAELTATLADFTIDLGNNTGTNLSVRLLFDTRSFSEEIVVDYIRVFGTSVALPLELLAFEAAETTAGTSLSWKTAAEIDFLGFEVERSLNSRVWKTIGWVDGQNRLEENNYTFVDAQAKEGKYYYRLKMMDRDGQSAYSPLRSLNLKYEGFRLGTPLPNPSTLNDAAVYLPVHVPHAGPAQLSVYNQQGQQVFQRQVNLQKGSQYLDIDATNLAVGLWYVHVQMAGYEGAVKLMRVK
ncbi:MAG: hypothetical protein AAF990_02930 [Bacteroidota bacterium]